MSARFCRIRTLCQPQFLFFLLFFTPTHPPTFTQRHNADYLCACFQLSHAPTKSCLAIMLQTFVNVRRVISAATIFSLKEAANSTQAHRACETPRNPHLSATAARVGVPEYRFSSSSDSQDSTLDTAISNYSVFLCGPRFCVDYAGVFTATTGVA